MGGCREEDPAIFSGNEGDQAVEVEFTMEEMPVDTDASIEPMSRGASYRNWISNACRMLILKKSENRWIVDGTETILLDPGLRIWNELRLTELPACSFSFELRPGDYRVVAVLNPYAATWNDELVPGTVVADEADPALHTPPLLTYTISTHWMNQGRRMLHREVFVAVTDFTVPKAGDLHGTGMAPVKLRAERRVGKFRILLKDNPDEYYSFELTAHTVNLILSSQQRPFPEGIDALGGMYYGQEGLYEMKWCFSTAGEFQTSGRGAYLMTLPNSTVFSPFLFADPEVEELTFRVSDITIAGASGGYAYKTEEVFDRELATNKITGIVFEATHKHENISSQIVVDVVEAVDAEGDPENAATLFDPYYEWNTRLY